MEHKELLHAVVEADRAARQALTDAQQRQKLLERGADEVLAAAEKKARAQAERELAQRRKAAEDETRSRMEALEKSRTEELLRLERQYAAVKDECVETIFKAAVGLS